MAPLGLLYVAAALKKKGVKVRFVDLAGDPKGKIPKAEYYGVTATTPQYASAKDIVKKIKKGKVCIGGPAATLRPKDCLDDGFDAAVVGEGEKAIFRFLEGETGIIREPFEKNLDSIAFPDRNLIKDYHYEINGKPAATIMTARGCYYGKCAFCSQCWPRIRYRSVTNVLHELFEIRDNYGYNAVMIYDDEFFANRKRDFQICHYLALLGFDWRCFSRADLINEKVARIAASTGCKEILIGIESGSPIILKNVHKGTTVQQNKRAIKILHNNKIRVKAAMIIMLPGENKETLKETWQFCEEMQPYVNAWDFTICTPYPGSRIFDNPDKYDFHFHKDAMYSAYKGAGVEAWIPPKVWTNHLSFEEGLKFRDKFEDRFKFEKDVKFDE